MPVREEIHFSTPGAPRPLDARFDARDAFSREYAENLSQGGIFIATASAFELRELVSVRLVLAFCAEVVELDGEVVSVRRGGIGGAPAGVAVQLLAPASELRARLSAWADPLDPARPDPELRQAPRTPARVEVHVEGAETAAHTVNLSTAGALLEADDDLPAIGQPIEFSVQHPVTGEARTIEGTVVRHHERSGTVRGVGVRFEADSETKPGVERFVEGVAAAAHAKSLADIRGSIAPLGLASLLQMFGASAPRGTLHMRRGEIDGSIAFDAGVLRHARLGEVGGPKALVRLLGWQEGAFEFHAEVEAGSPEDPPLPLDAAIFDAVRQLDELARVALPKSIAEASLRIDRARLDADPGPLEKVEEAVVDLVAAGFSVPRLLDVIPVSDAEIHAAIRALLERGIVVAAEPAARG